ncbi:hypothetical protein HPB50_007045 [Hyalomma asiaticum]|uniref:Uncharacterized protein n=1 Tax=Hyalomma asiaticum TaxID=266040 RepID=A0ACB7S195_HYAAI|nr:hypothetical protein HPB50_007045 [Hyalomma asiaticum]
MAKSEKLRTAINRVGSCLSTVRLPCSTSKSKNIVITSQGRKPKQAPFHFQLQGMQIPQTDHIRILGQASGGNSTALQRIDQSAIQIGCPHKRVPNKHAGMRESNLLRLVQAFVRTRITYVAPYLRLTSADLDRLYASLHKAYKTALGLPMSTSNYKLMALGVSSMVNELIEATLTSQYQRLSLTHAGRTVLHQTGLIPMRAATTYQGISTAQRLSLCIPPLPKHMHPEHHADRRADRARQLRNVSQVSLMSPTQTPLGTHIVNNGGCRPGPTPRLEQGMQCNSLHRYNSCFRGCHCFGND